MEGSGAQERGPVQGVPDPGASAKLDRQLGDPAAPERVQEALRAHQELGH